MLQDILEKSSNILKLKAALSVEPECRVEIIKKDGSPRTLICTLNKNIIRERTGKEYESEEDNNIEPNKPVRDNDLIVVFDLEKNSFRSFRYSQIIESYTKKGEKILCFGEKEIKK